MASIHQFLNQMPLICFKKDPDSYYSYVNNHIKEVGLINTLDEIIGKTDSQLPWEADADKYRQQDLLSLKGQKQFNLDILPKKDGGTLLHLCHKSPIFNEAGKIIEVGGMGIEINFQNFKDLFSLFLFAGLNFSDLVTTVQNKKQKFNYKNVTFSRRQAETISYLLRGYSAESTAKELKLSKRTIEFYLTNIKDKSNCYSKTELIKKAFEMGFIDLMFMKFE